MKQSIFYSSTEDLKAAIDIAALLAQSPMTPALFRSNTGGCLAALDAASRLGVDPITLMAAYREGVDGRPAWNHQFVRLLVEDKVPDFEIEYTGTPGGNDYTVRAKGTVRGKLREGPAITRHYIEANGWMNPGYETMPEILYTARATSLFAAMHCPGLTLCFTPMEDEAQARTYAKGIKGIEVLPEQQPNGAAVAQQSAAIFTQVLEQTPVAQVPAPTTDEASAADSTGAKPQPVQANAQTTDTARQDAVEPEPAKAVKSTKARTPKPAAQTPAPETVQAPAQASTAPAVDMIGANQESAAPQTEAPSLEKAMECIDKMQPTAESVEGVIQCIDQFTGDAAHSLRDVAADTAKRVLLQINNKIKTTDKPQDFLAAALKLLQPAMLAQAKSGEAGAVVEFKATLTVLTMFANNASCNHMLIQPLQCVLAQAVSERLFTEPTSLSASVGYSICKAIIDGGAWEQRPYAKDVRGFVGSYQDLRKAMTEVTQAETV
jgi:hypothetical protein